MPIYNSSIIVSNIFDPLTHDEHELCNLYLKLARMKRYISIETRLFKETTIRNICNENFKEESFTFWITGELSRANLNLSSPVDLKRGLAVQKVKEMMREAALSNCVWLGIASGKIETTISEGVTAFVKSVTELLEEINLKNYSFKLLIEPLDQFAHKCNVLGTSKTVKSFMERLPLSAIVNKQVCLCWDSAHVALNEDDFETSFAILAPYIVRVHFANAILDKHSSLYGDYHINFCNDGFLNLESASKIKKLMDKYLTGEISVAVEVRETNRDRVWQLENECYEFLKQVLQ